MLDYIHVGEPKLIKSLFVKDKDVEFDIRMKSYNGFQLPLDCDIDMEIKFTIIPKPQYPNIKTFK